MRIEDEEHKNNRYNLSKQQSILNEGFPAFCPYYLPRKVNNNVKTTGIDLSFSSNNFRHQTTENSGAGEQIVCNGNVTRVR